MQQGSYKDFQTRDVPVPKPKANEVLVRVHAVSLQVCASYELFVWSTLIILGSVSRPGYLEGKL